MKKVFAVVVATVMFGSSARADTAYNKAARAEIDRMRETVCSGMPDGPPGFPGIFRMACGMKFVNIANEMQYRPDASVREVATFMAKAKEMAHYYESGSYRTSKPPW